MPGDVPRVVDDQAVAVALRQLGVEEVERPVERVDQVAGILVGRAARALQRVRGAELHAADVAAVHLDLERLVVGRREIAADADVLVAAVRPEEFRRSAAAVGVALAAPSDRGWRESDP
jgi:hypothetical protein